MESEDIAITRINELISFFENPKEYGFEDLMKEERNLHMKLVLIQYLQQKKKSCS